MAVAPTVIQDGQYSRYEWVLTASDQVASPTPPLPARNEKSIDVRGASDANGFNGAMLQIHGSLDLGSNTNFKLLHTVTDTVNGVTELAFSAASATIYTILPHVAQVKPVVPVGTVGATGVTVVLLVTSAQPHTH